MATRTAPPFYNAKSMAAHLYASGFGPLNVKTDSDFMEVMVSLGVSAGDLDASFNEVRAELQSIDEAMKKIAKREAANA